MSKDDPITKQDVEEIVGRVVGEIASSMMQMIAERFEAQDKVSAGMQNNIAGMQETITDTQNIVADMQADISDVRASQNRIENKLDATIDQVDRHETQIQELQRLKPRTA